MAPLACPYKTCQVCHEPYCYQSTGCQRTWWRPRHPEVWGLWAFLPHSQLAVEALCAVSSSLSCSASVRSIHSTTPPPFSFNSERSNLVFYAQTSIAMPTGVRPVCVPMLVLAGCGGTKGSIQPMNLVRDVKGPLALQVRDLWAFLCQCWLAVEALSAVSSPWSWSVQFNALTSHLFFLFFELRKKHASNLVVYTHSHSIVTSGKLDKKRCEACGAVWLQRHYGQHKAHDPRGTMDSMKPMILEALWTA